MKKTLRNFLLLCPIIAIGQSSYENSYSSIFEKVQENHPGIPSGLLEAVSFSNTRFEHLSGENESCTGMPLTFGVLGLVEDGKNYFNNNLIMVSELSGIPVSEIKTDPTLEVEAFAIAYDQIKSRFESDKKPIISQSDLKTLAALSELPSSTNTQKFAVDCYLYQVLSFLKKNHHSSLDISSYFGEENFQALTSPGVILNSQKVSGGGNQYSSTNSVTSSPDYAPALWNQAASCNYSSRSGTAISAVTIHTVQGSYAGCISWFQNCSAGVSAHYVVRSSDGQITQMVYESQKAWHVGSENPYTIGIEHEGYVTNSAWYTNAMYTSSAALCRDICNSGYGISPLRTFQGPATSGINVLGGCTKIKGHQHYQNQTHTDPGINWNWEKFYQLINNNPSLVQD